MSVFKIGKNTFQSFLLRKLGRIFDARGNGILAALFYRESLRLTPKDVALLFDQARSFWREGRIDEAEAALQQLLHEHPDSVEALNLQGVILLGKGLLDLAEDNFRKAIDISPGFAAAYNNLGNVFLERGETGRAEVAYRDALEVSPNYVEALNNLGLALNKRGQYAEAERECRKAIKWRPDFAGAISNLGNILFNQGRLGEAVRYYREALELEPGLAEAHINLAIALNEPAHLVGAIEYYEKVLERSSDSLLALIRLGQAYQAMGNWSVAQEKLARALELRPNAQDALAMMGNNYAYQAFYGEALSCYRKALAQGPNAGIHSSYLFDLMYDPEISGERLRQEHLQWAELYGAGALKGVPELHTNAPEPMRRLRIGYVSGDFCRHSVAYFIEPVIRHHQRDQVEVYCYSNVINPDHVTERIRQTADVWRDVALISNEELCQLICQDQIDILVDLSGHTSRNRILVFAQKPAPVQVTYLGYPCTTGLQAIDYRIADAVTDRLGTAEDDFVEELVRLPGTFLNYQPLAEAPEVGPLPSIAKGYITFGSFNSLIKVNKDVVKLWASILHAVPNSRLMLKGYALSSQKTRDSFTDMFEQNGIGPERLTLVDWNSTVSGHLDLYNEIDIGLDPFPYNGTTTTCEALWMGVPVISLAGDKHVSRVGASLMGAVGLSELVADSSEEYVAIAVSLATDTGQLNRLRTMLRDMMRQSTLLDTTEYVKNLETAYRSMWQAWCSKQSGKIESREAVRNTESDALMMDGNVIVHLPKSLSVITRYVLEEQGDWFEPEIRFVRAWIENGMQVIDVGANYGVYSLSMAKVVGQEGRVWAIEPSAETSSFLGKSITANQFGNLLVIQAALSDYEGHGQLKSGMHSEASSLLPLEHQDAGQIQVDVTTLDKLLEKHRWPRVDFIKIDAEGQEVNIVRGGQGLFSQQSPLVMAEYKHGATYHLELLREFSSLGYSAYRLLPRLQVLVPFGEDEVPDKLWLNLFFCKPDRTSQLSEAGWLARCDTVGASGSDEADRKWLEYFGSLTYAKELISLWERRFEPQLDDQARSYSAALAHYAYCRASCHPADARVERLYSARQLMEELVSRDANISRRATLARIYADMAYSEKAVDVLLEIKRELLETDTIALEEPFLAVSEKFESIAVGQGKLKDWLLASVLEQLESLGHFSSYFVGAPALRSFRWIKSLGFCEKEMNQRISLILRETGYIDEYGG